MIFVLCGSLALSLASLGAILPLLPNTPFYSCQAFFMDEDPAGSTVGFYDNPHFGEYLRRNRDKKDISLRRKVFTLILLWVGILSTVWLAIPVEQYLLSVLLLLIDAGVSIHVMLIKNLKKKRRHAPETRN